MIVYEEYVKGLPTFAPLIAEAPLFAERGGINMDCYYLTNQSRDEEDEFPIADVMKLPMNVVKVVLSPGAEPVEKHLYIDGMFAYNVTLEK